MSQRELSFFGAFALVMRNAKQSGETWRNKKRKCSKWGPIVSTWGPPQILPKFSVTTKFRRISKISKTSLNKRSTELAVCCLWASSMSALFRPSTRDASCELVIQKAKSGWKKWKQMEKHVCRNASFSRKNSLALNQLSLFLPVSICYFRSSPLDLEPWDHYCRNTGM